MRNQARYAGEPETLWGLHRTRKREGCGAGYRSPIGADIPPPRAAHTLGPAGRHGLHPAERPGEPHRRTLARERANGADKGRDVLNGNRSRLKGCQAPGKDRQRANGADGTQRVREAPSTPPADAAAVKGYCREHRPHQRPTPRRTRRRDFG